MDTNYWKRNKISRRGLMRGASVGALGLAGASLIGCDTFGGGGEGTKGGTLTSAPDIELSSTDPAFFTSDAEAAIGWQAGENLVVKQHDLTMTGAVAESWETEDQQEYIFNLRKNNTFSNGDEVTAADVKFTFDRIFALEAPPTGQLGSLDPTKGGRTEVIDDHTVKMTLDKPNAFWVNTLSFYQGKIVPQNDDPTNWGIGKYVGSGAYKMVSNQPGEGTTFERRADYWGADNTYFDGIQFTYLPEPESRIEALKGGAIHQVNRLTPASVPEVDNSGVARASQATSASYMTLAMNTLIAPFNDQRVRQALQAASNREQNVAKVIEGLGAVANDHPIAPNDPHYDSSVAIPEYDPKKARDLLAAAGYADGLEVPIVTMGAAMHEEVALTFQEYAREAGFNARIDKKPEDEYWSKWWLNQEVQLCTVNWNGRNPDAALSIVYHGDAPWNETYQKDAKLDGLIERARGEDLDARKETYSEVQKHLVEQAYRVIPFFVNTLMGVATNVQNIEAHPSRWPFLSRGWFEEA